MSGVEEGAAAGGAAGGGGAAAGTAGAGAGAAGTAAGAGAAGTAAGGTGLTIGNVGAGGLGAGGSGAGFGGITIGNIGGGATGSSALGSQAGWLGSLAGSAKDLATPSNAGVGLSAYKILRDELRGPPLPPALQRQKPGPVQAPTLGGPAPQTKFAGMTPQQRLALVGRY